MWNLSPDNSWVLIHDWSNTGISVIFVVLASALVGAFYWLRKKK